MRRLLWILTIGAMAGVAASLVNPVNSKLLRLAFLGFLATTWLGWWILNWHATWLRWSWGMAPLLLAGLFLLPARELDRVALRADYVQRMQSFEGVRYFWGGESRLGMDCSGLPRRALRDALLWRGLFSFDGGALRMAAGLWWYDASAEVLGQGYRGLTAPLGIKGRIAEMDDAPFQPGDLAVTSNGRHVLAYVGKGRWIQADISLGEVVELNGKQDENPWFQTPVSLHRWSMIAGEASDR